MFINGQPGSFQKYQVDTMQALILKVARLYQYFEQYKRKLGKSIENITLTNKRKTRFLVFLGAP